MSYNNYKTELMIEMKRKMDTIIISAKEENDIFLCNIYDSVCKYVNMNCNHNYIEDWIDQSPEKTHRIEYCTYCYESLSPVSSNTLFNTESESKQMPK
jgi:hypothetical protein